MKNFIEKRFPEDIAYMSIGGPEFSTDVLITASGFEQRNINWAQARCKYDIASSLTAKKQLDELIALFRACRGKALGFRLKDFTDYTAKNQLIGLGNGKLNQYQLTKTYTFAEQEYVRLIYKPVPNSVNIWIDNLAVDFDCDYCTGIITLAQIPEVNQKIEASFEFDVPVRFDTDRLSTNLLDYASGNALQISLIEIKTKAM
ncbi:MAG: DUF2460 domain-containing protein [Rickettsiales bacterium]